MKPLFLFILILGLAAGCMPAEERRNLELAEDQLDNWSASTTLKSDPPLRFENRIYYDTSGNPYSGPWTSAHPNGQTEWQAECSQGRLHGPVRSFYRDGSPAQIRHYEYGVLKGAFEEWYPNGDLKLKGILKGPTYYGGDRITEFTVGYYGNGRLNIVERKKGRIQMINNARRTPYENEMIELTQQEGYMLFSYNWMGRMEVIAVDSRGEYPAFENWDEYQ